MMENQDSGSKNEFKMLESKCSNVQKNAKKMLTAENGHFRIGAKTEKMVRKVTKMVFGAQNHIKRSEIEKEMSQNLKKWLNSFW